MLAYYEKHNMEQRLQKIMKNHAHMSEAKLRRTLEKWDIDQGRAMRYAEKSLGKRRVQKHYWSPSLRNAGLLCRYWHLRLYGQQRQRDITASIARLLKIIRKHDHNYSFPLQDTLLSITTIAEQWNKAKKALKAIQNNARELRYQSYEDLLFKYEFDSNPESVRRKKIVASTIRTEKCRDTFRQIRIAAKPFQESSGGLTSVMVPRISVPKSTASQAPNENTGAHFYEWLTAHPEGPTEWEIVTERNKVEHHLLSYNQASFKAASTSPCGHGTILDDLTFSSISEAGDTILQGQIPERWHIENQLLSEFLKSFASPSGTAPIDVDIQADDIKRGFGKWRESTSTSPSGRHLGHYRAAIQNDRLLHCITTFMSIIVARGISIRRWQQAINIMLEKDPGRPAINRLRIIHLFEADFNLFLKLTWGSRLVRQAQQTNMIHNGQYGSVPGRTAIELVMLQQISNDICRTNKVNLIRFDNDASACYDRILVHLGMLAARRVGMPDNAVRIHADTLKNMHYKVKTVFGISNDSYTGEPRQPLFGTGQGSGASPAVWLTLVVVLMNTLDRLTKERTRFRSPDSPMHHKRLIDAFVDDTSLVFNDSQQLMAPEQLTRQMEQIAQRWERLLALSGGALNLKKCSWHMMYWEWRHGRPRLRPRTTTDPNIALQTQTGTLSTSATIRYTSPDESTRILGVHLNPLGDFTKQIQVLQEKSDKMANHIRTSRITPTHMHTFLHSMYIPAMVYALPAVAADEEALAVVQTKMMGVALNKLGASKNTPTAIRHGPKEYGGMNLTDLRTELGISNIKFFRQAIYSNSEAGKLLLISLKYTQIEAGIPENLLDRPDKHLSYLTPTWITSLRQFLFQHNVTISITDTLYIVYSGPHDKCIMDTDAIKFYTPQQQRDINLVRLHLQAITLSDLSNPDGKTIRHHALAGIRKENQRLRQHWPRQDVVTASQRRLWKNYITSNFIRYGQAWRNSLGSTRPDLRPRPPWQHQFVAPSMEDVFRTEPSNDLSMYMSRLPRWHQRLLSNWQQIATDNQIWKAFRSRRRLTIASDGGLKQSIGTLGWKIVDKDGLPLFTGSGPVDGPFDIANSTRSELGGIAAPLLLCASLARYWGLAHRCRYKWLTDSKAAISRVTFITRRSSQPRRYPDDVDYDTAIRELHQCLGGRNLQPTWVKGHQDENADYASLSPEAKLNVDADTLASEHYWSGKGLKPKTQIPHLVEFRVTISINGVRYTSKVDQQLRYHINGTYLKQYLQSQHRWNDKIWHLIDFTSFGRHFGKLTGTKMIQHMKFVHNLQPIGSNLKKRVRPIHGDLDNAFLCPCCRMEVETQPHMLQCKKNPHRKKSLATFKKTTSRRDNNRFTQIFGDLVAQWLAHPDSIPTFTRCRDTFLCHDIIPLEYSNLVQLAINDQSAIGWDHALRGFLSITWTKLANCSYDASGIIHSNHDQDNGRRLQRTLHALYQLTTNIWHGRNEALHATHTSTTRECQNVIDIEITRLHSEPELLHQDDKFYCDQSLRRILQSGGSTKRRWLLRVKKSRERKALSLKHQPRITSYFPRESAPLSGNHQYHDDQSQDGCCNSQQPSARNKTVQKLITFFLRERAPEELLPGCVSHKSPAAS